MEAYGFVYIWKDRKHSRYYIGSHWGFEDDGYICSSPWMKSSFKRRPNDFKRRILSRIYTNRSSLLEEEFTWLSMIKDEHIGKKYYNLNKHKSGHWSTCEKTKLTVGQKISASPNRNSNIAKAHLGKKHTEETKNKIRIVNLGKKHTEEAKRKISQNSSKNRNYDEEFRSKISYAAKNRSKETRLKISENNKRLISEGKIGMQGKKHSYATKEKMKRKKETIKCPYCDTIGGIGIMKRWHFNNCKKNK